MALGLAFALVGAEVGARALVGAQPLRELPRPGDASGRSSPIERVKHKGLRFALRPGGRQAMIYPSWTPGEPERRVLYAINEDGFRDRRYERPKPAGTVRVAVLGDSFTFGNGVALDETLPKVAERALQGFVPEIPVEVMNCGVGGYDTDQEVGLLEWRVLPFEPDLVVIVYYLNDVFVHSGSGEETEVWQGRWARKLANLLGSRRSEEAPAGDAALGPAGAARLAGSQLLGLVAEGLKAGLTSRAYHANLARAYAPGAHGWRRVLEAFERAVRLGDEHGFAVHLTIFPDLRHALDGSYPFTAFEQQVVAAARECGITVHDTAAALVGRSPAELMVHPADPHGSALCNELLGRALAQELAGTVRRFSRGAPEPRPRNASEDLVDERRVGAIRLEPGDERE